MTKRIALVGVIAVLLASIVTLDPVRLVTAAIQSAVLNPGDSITITCPTKLVNRTVNNARTKETVSCKGASATPSPTPSPPSPTPTPPPPTPTPTPPQPTPTPTPIPTPSPTPTPLPDTSICTGSDIVGYGAGTTGGNGGPIFSPTSVAALRTALNASGPRTINLPTAAQVWDLGGQDLAITKPFVTINGGGVIFKRGSIKITTSQVILNDVSSHSGDEAPVNGQDVDSITINGNAAPRDHIVLNHVQAIWGPDVSAVILGRVTDVTIQCSIIGEGLLHSSHPESVDADGHGLAFNMASEDSANASDRITIYGTLFTTSQSRQPRIIGANHIDIIDSVFYNYAEGPQGNPQSLNLVGNTWKGGPAAADAGIPFSSLLWRYQPGGHGAFGTRLNGTVYIGDTLVIGFSAATPSGDDAAVLRPTPNGSLSVASIGASEAFDMVTGSAGPRPANTQTLRLRANALNGTGIYFNGAGKPAPNPTWP